MSASNVLYAWPVRNRISRAIAVDGRAGRSTWIDDTGSKLGIADVLATGLWRVSSTSICLI
ncbi:MAG: hypothetical protein AB1832_06745 [Pseudomonadota bacterium]